MPKSSRGRNSPPHAFLEVALGEAHERQTETQSPSVFRRSSLSQRLEHDSPELRRPEEMQDFLGQLYNREVSETDTVTVIRFSEIKRG